MLVYALHWKLPTVAKNENNLNVFSVGRSVSKTVVFVRIAYPALDQSLSKDKNPRQKFCGFGRFLSL